MKLLKIKVKDVKTLGGPYLKYNDLFSNRRISKYIYYNLFDGIYLYMSLWISALIKEVEELSLTHWALACGKAAKKRA